MESLLYTQETSVLGAGLLPPDLEKERSRILTVMAAAYANVLPASQENYALWNSARTLVMDTIRERYHKAGLSAPPWNWDALWRRIDLSAPGKDPNAHVALIRALMTDYQQRFCEHIQYRLQHHGNVHLEFSGPTGMAKSSCAISVANWIRPIAPDQLPSHLSFDLGDLPSKLRNKKPGQTVIQDEFVQVAGEGARTFKSLFENLEDTLRASQINLFSVSPRRQEHATSQAELELILWDPKRAFSVFLVWLEGQPHGVVALPWAPAALWKAYTPWKKANTERAVSGQFRDNSFLVRSALRAFSDPRFVAFLSEAGAKPKKADFETALSFFHPEMMATSQSDRMVLLMHNICYNFDRIGPKFEEWFGLPPNQGLIEVAKKCYTD